MDTCKNCQEKQKRIEQLEGLIRRMAESADALERKIAANVIEFPGLMAATASPQPAMKINNDAA
jgi:hypothetical protein